MKQLLPLTFLLVFSAACGPDDVAIEPLPSQTVRVSETLRVPLRVPGGGAFTFGFMAPDSLAAFDTTASINGTAQSGGEFRWTPLSSHVGTHEITIQLLDQGDVVSQTPLVVTVMPGADSAPTFLRPRAGNTYDLRSEPCVRFDIEIRDEDSASIEITARGELPEGATLTQTGPKRGDFEWCPTSDQIASSERWTIPLRADDATGGAVGNSTDLDYIAVLRGDAKDGCPGMAPVVQVLSPSEGGRVTGQSYEVRANVSDDMGLRDAPLLFYSTSRPDDLVNPDVTAFEQLVMRPNAGAWTARVPTLNLADGDTADVYILVSATDNDDATGAACDHRTDSSLLQFEAVGGEGGGDLALCEACSASAECASGLCASAASGARCIESCSGGGVCGAGSCGSSPSIEGAVLAGCGPVSDVCGMVRMCTGDDSREDDDSIAEATMYSGRITDGEICAMDSDYFRIPVGADESVTVTLDGFSHIEGDLDLQLLDPEGIILQSSASALDLEAVTHCFQTGGTTYARVLGYDGASGSYNLRVESSAGGCCVDDGFEGNDTREEARLTTLSMPSTEISGTLCPGDPDFYAFDLTGAAELTITMLIDLVTADLDLQLYSPSGTILATSDEFAGEDENITLRVTEAGRYVLEISGFRNASSDYLVDIIVGAASGCASDNDCPLAEVCNAGACVDRTCMFSLACPSMPMLHSCPTPGPGTGGECGAVCTVNGDCRAAEACKWFPEGRFCARRGPGQNGDACADFSECGGQRACLPWTGGTCARAGCASNAECETGTYCIADVALGVNVCARSCWSSDAICRTGYECGFREDVGEDLQAVCVPE